MKCLKRNERTFYYAPFVRMGNSERGFGQRPIYGDAVALKANISPATGTTSAEQFGNNVEYDKVIVLDNPNCPVDENSLLFVDVEPTKNHNGDYVNDYIVKKVARSLNSVSIAISKVKVS